MNFAGVQSITIPEGDVRSVAIGGVIVWTKPNPLPYVAEGLVAWWDGIWNAGIGVHDDDATVWKDLVGTRDLTLNASGVSWSDNALVSAISTRNAAEYTGGVPTTDFYTVELVKGATTGRSVLVLGGTAARTDTGFVLVSGTSAFRVATGANNEARREIATGAELHSVQHLSVRYSAPGSTASSVLADGVALALSHDGAWGGSNNLRGICVFGRSANDAYGANGYPVRGSCHCLRLYSRQLTDAEVAANYAADKARFNLP